jgi:GT2 family glycosyltransferase
MGAMEQVGVVVIGRNEGARLRACLETLVPHVERTVYVDSASTDDSVEIARSFGVEVVELTDEVPLSAGRGRNAGFDRVILSHPAIRYVQFIDGDCELLPGWLEAALAELRGDSHLAFVAGRLVERERSASVYNRLCDIEWAVPPGDVDACGGVFMTAVEPFAGVGGFDPSFIAGEEGELAARVRARGFGIRRIAARMATHDANMKQFSQWWRRQMRAGFGYAEGAHRLRNRRHLRRMISNLVYGLGIPGAVVVSAPPTLGASSVLALVYPLLLARVWRHRRREGHTRGDAALDAFFNVLGKPPQALGGLKYVWERILLQRGPRIIEHKPVP